MKDRGKGATGPGKGQLNDASVSTPGTVDRRGNPSPSKKAIAKRLAGAKGSRKVYGMGSMGVKGKKDLFGGRKGFNTD